MQTSTEIQHPTPTNLTSLPPGTAVPITNDQLWPTRLDSKTKMSLVRARATIAMLLSTKGASQHTASVSPTEASSLRKSLSSRALRATILCLVSRCVRALSSSCKARDCRSILTPPQTCSCRIFWPRTAKPIFLRRPTYNTTTKIKAATLLVSLNACSGRKTCGKAQTLKSRKS